MPPPPTRAAAPPAFVQLADHPLRWRLMLELADSDYRVRDLVARVDEPQNLVSYHLRLLRDGGLVTTNRSSFDGRESYYHLDLGRCADALSASGAALHPALARGDALPGPATALAQEDVAVLFVCTGNSARSPIAEALLRHHTSSRAHVTSAGSHPRSRLHANTVRVLRDEFGIDVSGQRPRHLDEVAGRRFHHVVTLCDRVREVCPEFGSRPRRVHWSIPDPATTDESSPANYGDFQRTAAEIDTRIRQSLPVLANTISQHQEAQP
jgi:protein-tyrosine-phosphatase/DNA-binding transcriptional ArsR family regulator